MKLSILIPTVISRKKELQELLTSLHSQIIEFKDIEILVCPDNKEISIGAKRQKLLEMAKGEYVVFIDDDDSVSDVYVKSIYEALQFNPDTVGFMIECTFNGKGECLASASNKYKDWSQDQDGFKYVRTPYQKTPIKRDIALQIGYKDMRFGEDYEYSKRLKESGLIKTEEYINKILYYYKYVHQDHNTKYGITN